MEFIKLLEDDKAVIWNTYPDFDPIFKEVGAPFPPVEHLEHIGKNKGEKIIAYDKENETILGWIGIIPRKGEYAELAGIEVNRNYRNQSIATDLILNAQEYLSRRNINEFRFQTSPLFTSNSLLYLSRFRTKYSWNNSVALPPDNVPWPVVDCLMKWPVNEKPANTPSEKNLASRSIINWKNMFPIVDDEILSQNPAVHVVELPFLDLPTVFNCLRNNCFEITQIPFRIFDLLNERNYRINQFVRQNDRYFYLLENCIN